MKSKEEIKLEFFKKFDNESFRGYPLEQCNSIWDFFEKHIQCQEDMADKKYTEEEVIELLQKALTHQNDAEIGSLVTIQKEIRPANFYSWFNKFKKLNKQD